VNSATGSIRDFLCEISAISAVREAFSTAESVEKRLGERRGESLLRIPNEPVEFKSQTIHSYDYCINFPFMVWALRCKGNWV
jgi:hypothetical protein